MARTVIDSLESLRSWVGRPLGSSEWFTLDQARIDAFAEATGDRQWIHVDPERARRESPWKKTVAHGYLTLSLAPVLFSELLEVRGHGTMINTGIDRLRLRSPIPAGSRLRMAAEIRSARSLPGGGVRIGVDVRFEVDGEARPACVGTLVFAYLPGPG